jgi:hypothetical protein
MTVVRRKRSKVTIGGERHRGWLPPGASLPLPDRVREVTVDISIEEDGGAFFLITSSTDPSIFGDTWHETLASAERFAFKAFGVTASDWR